MKLKVFCKYMSYVVRHKWYVGRECFKHHLYWQGITHDISKLLPSEFVPYANYFYGNYKKFLKNGRIHAPGKNDAFDYAWLLHQKRNKHHWQWFLLQNDTDGLRLLDMPDRYIVEMVCDWKGAGKAQGHKQPGELQQWYMANKDKMQLSEITRFKVEQLLEEVF